MGPLGPGPYGGSGQEGVQAWEAYLAQYPQSLYLEQIRRDITQAEAELYGEEIVDESGTRRQRRGLKFPEMAMGENLNPATRVKVGFDWGIPAWINLIGDVEYAFAPRFSAHMGMRKRYSGWSLDLGPRFAVVKDADLGLIVSLSGDLHVNVDPAFTGLRPGVQVGKILFDKVFVQIQGAPEWQLVEGYWTTQVIGGGQLAYRASRAVGMFIEANLASQYFGLPSRNPTFHTVVFGMRFYPSAKGVSADDKSDVLIGAGIPLWTHPSWDFFDGAATVQSHLYLE